MLKTFLLLNKNVFYKAWTALLWLNILGFILTAQITNELQFSMFTGILFAMLNFYPFYYLSKKGQLNTKEFSIFLLIMLPIAIAQFYVQRVNLISGRISANEDVVINVAYNFVVLFPFVFLLKNKVLSVACTIIILFFIIAGSKRGAIVVGMIILFWYFYYQMRTVDKKHKWTGYLLSLISIITIIFFSYKYYLDNEYLQYRIQLALAGDTSYRDVIYSNIWDNWLNSDLFHLFFGYGFAASLKLTGGSYAHNDWLELLSNFGLLGITIFAIQFYQGFKLCLNKEWESDKRILMVSIITSAFATSLFSMWYPSVRTYLNAILLGYLTGNKSTKLK